jgi:hypothetical protein
MLYIAYLVFGMFIIGLVKSLAELLLILPLILQPISITAFIFLVCYLMVLLSAKIIEICQW